MRGTSSNRGHLQQMFCPTDSPYSELENNGYYNTVNKGGGVQTNFDQIVAENRGLQHKNDEMAERLRFELDTRTKCMEENTRLHERVGILEKATRKFKNDLLSYRSEYDRMSTEHQLEITKLQNSVKKWRLNVKKQESFLSRKLEKVPSPLLFADEPKEVLAWA